MNKLEKCRKTFNLSLDYVAKYLNLSTYDYTLIEKGIVFPNCTQIEKLENLYKLDFKDIIQKIREHELEQEYNSRE